MNVTVLVALCAGCSVTDSSEQQELPITLKRIVSDAQTVTPAAALLPTARERSLILTAYDTLMGRCVDDHNMTLSLGDAERPTWLSSLTVPFAGPAPYGPVDPQRMERFGYRDPNHAPKDEQSIVWTGKPTPNELLKLCDKSVVTSFGGKPPIDLHRLIIDAGRRAGADPRRRAPRKAWSACMKSFGFNYVGDRDPWAEFAINSTTTSNAPSKKELQVARADAQCQARARNIDTHVALVVAYQLDALSKNAEKVNEFKAYVRDLLRVSSDVVSRFPAPRNRTVSTSGQLQSANPS